MKTKFNLSEKSIDTFKNLDGVNVKDVFLGCDVKEFIKRQIDYQDLKIKLTQENEDLDLEEKNLIIANCINTKIKLKKDAGNKLK